MGQTIKVTIQIDETTTEEIELPARWAICPRCDGEGKHVNPAVDGHGISSEEFDDDPDFREAYFEGRYDIRCENGCRDGKVLEPDPDRCKPELLRAYEDEQERNARQDRDDRVTLYYESGGTMGSRS